MTQQNFLKIYIRKTNGSGQQVSLNPIVSSKQLHTFTSHLFNLQQKSFDLYFKGNRILDTNEITISELGIESDSIVHVHEKNQDDDHGEGVELRVFYQGSVYCYKGSKFSTIRDFKFQIVNMLGCQVQDVTVSYLGKEMQDSGTLGDQNIKNKDYISVVVNPMLRLGRRNVSWLKPKMAESMTFANTEECENSIMPFAEKMRKSSMKSSHQSRQLKIQQSKKLLQIIRPKSQLTKSNNNNNNETDPNKEQPNIEINNLAWLTNQKMIQTQSINLQEEQIEEGPEMWQECLMEISNKEKTHFYVLECNQGHDLTAVVRVISRCEGNFMGKVEIIFGDEASQLRAETGVKILDIARETNTKIIREVIFTLGEIKDTD